MKKTVTILSLLVLSLLTSSFAQFKFEELSSSGLEGRKGVHISTSDYDRDGDLDLFLVAFNDTNRFFRNNGDNTFTDVSYSVGLTHSAYGYTAVWGDYNNDGYADIYVANAGSANMLYKNNGNGTFTEVGSTAGVADAGTSIAAAWMDYDQDGNLDLFVPKVGAPDLLYHNQGDGTFADSAAVAGVADNGFGTGAMTMDYDNDGYADLVVLRYSNSTLLYRNLGNGHFNEGASNAGINFAGNGKETLPLDFNNDGNMDIYITAVGESNILYKNNGDGTFSAMSPSFGAANNCNTSGAAVGDFDNDGDVDIYVSNNPQKNLLFLNTGNGFSLAEDSVCYVIGSGSKGVVAADFNNDGLLDVAIAMYDCPPKILLNKELSDTPNYWTKLELVATVSANHGAGTTVSLYVNGNRIAQTFDGMSTMHFGLGSTASVDSVVISWTSGQVQRLLNVLPLTLNSVIEPTVTDHREKLLVRQLRVRSGHRPKHNEHSNKGKKDDHEKDNEKKMDVEEQAEIHLIGKLEDLSTPFDPAHDRLTIRIGDYTFTSGTMVRSERDEEDEDDEDEFDVSPSYFISNEQAKSRKLFFGYDTEKNIFRFRYRNDDDNLGSFDHSLKVTVGFGDQIAELDIDLVREGNWLVFKDNTVTLGKSGNANKATFVTPEHIELLSNFPNPFNPQTTIRVVMQDPAEIQLNIYNSRGQKVATLAKETRDAGIHQFAWNASNLASGMYFYEVVLNGQREIRRMTLLK